MQDVIYHYTNAFGFKEIIKTKHLHASHFRFLNDPSEGRHTDQAVEHLFSRACSELIDEKKLEEPDLPFTQGTPIENREHKIRALANGLAQEFLTTPHKSSTPFVISHSQHVSQFQKENGILSQWRYYGSDGGYALGFNRSAWESHLKRELDEYRYWTVELCAVTYQFPSWQDDMVANAKNLVLQGRIQNIPSDDESALAKLASELSTIALSNKSAAFEDEREVRAIFKTYNGTLNGDTRPAKIIDFKVRQGLLVPFIQIAIQDMTSFVSEVLVGPHPNVERRKEAIVLYLAQNGLSDIPVRQSEIAITNLF